MKYTTCENCNQGLVMWTVTVLLSFGVSPLHTVAADPVAEYPFNGSVAETAHDQSHGAYHAVVHDARRVDTPYGRALFLDGQLGYVDCGNPSALDLRKTITLEAWVYPTQVPKGEVGLLGKGTDSYALTYYRGGRCWFYISDGAHHCSARIAPNHWYHLVATYDGASMRLHVNGKLRDSRTLDVPINSGGKFMIGDLGDSPGNRFAGMMDDVRVYAQSLSAEEVLNAYKNSGRAKLIQRDPIDPVAQLEGNAWSLAVGSTGAAEIQIGSDRYALESSFSHPGSALGVNTLAADRRQSETAWQPRVTTVDKNHLRVEAHGKFYSLVREFALERHRVVVRDVLTNLREEDVGVIVRNQWTTPQEPTQTLLMGAPEMSMTLCAENPTLYIEQPDSRLGVLAEDTLSRLQMEGYSSLNRSEFSLPRLALKPDASLSLQWAIYPLDGRANYFTFINQVRRDWDVNFMIQGPWSFFDVIKHHDLLKDQERLAAYLQRKRLHTVALMPWLDYDNFNNRTNRPVDRDEYKTLMREAASALRAAQPGVKITGCIEGNIVSLPESIVRPLFEALPADQRQQDTGVPFTDAQKKILKDVQLPWLDSLLQGADGRYLYELYYRGSQRQTPMMAILTYAEPGNAMARYWLDQARFLMDDVGLDGIYIDQFNLAFRDTQRYSHEKWDGVTVDIDAATGRIARRYTDGAYVGAEARQSLIEYVLSKNGTIVTNTNAAVQQTQALPIARFMEGEWAFDFQSMKLGEKPPLRSELCKGQLASPLALGSRPGFHGEQGRQEYSTYIMKTVIAYLRHGLLYYHYQTEIPESGPGSGEYGPINHMFPLTPVGLHEGWIEGKQRTITCVSGEYRIERNKEPNILVFDQTGRPTDVQARKTKTPNGWLVELHLKDWAEIAVIE